MPILLLATIPVTEKDASDFGILKADENQNITSFIEKPTNDLLVDWPSDTGAEMQRLGKVYLASMGIYIFNRRVLQDLLMNVYPEDKDFGKEIIPKVIGNYKVLSYQYEGYWEDIGQIGSFFEANLALTDAIPPFNLFDNNNAVFTRPRMLPPAKISGTTLEQTIIAEGSIIHASRIEHSVIGIRSRVGNGTTIVSSYLMGNDFYETLEEINQNSQHGIPKIGIGDRCHIKNAIIDKNVRIGNDVRIIGGDGIGDADNKLYTIKDSIVVVKKNAVIPDGYVIQ